MKMEFLKPSPIGIDIGAESPEEIAISVCAEIMALDKGIRE